MLQTDIIFGWGEAVEPHAINVVCAQLNYSAPSSSLSFGDDLTVMIYPARHVSLLRL
jgi:hypothetical protein